MDKEMTEREAFEAWWADNHSKPFNHKESAIELWKAAYKAGAAAERATPGKCARAIAPLLEDLASERAVSDKLLGALRKLSILGNGDKPGNSIGNIIAIEAIAEVESMLKESKE